MSLIVSMYKRTPKGMVFHLDDDMMNFVENRQIFNIELKTLADDKVEMIMEEVQF